MDAIKRAFDEDKRDSEVMKSFGFRLRNQFSLNKSYRRPKELEWLESLRQYKGLYDPDVTIEANNSKVYPKLTRSKVNIVLSRLHEMLFPETDKNWEITPTPEPRIAKEIVKEIAMSLVATDEETGEQTLPTAEDLHLAIIKFAKETCGKMESEIDDQFTEMDYPEETKKVLRSGLMYGTGVIKGPLIAKRTRRRWEPTKDGDYEEMASDQDTPELKFVRLWDWYPDMSVVDLEKSEGSFERHILTKHDLRQLAKRKDFYGDKITEFLTEHRGGNYVPQNWEVDLQVIETEAAGGKSGSGSVRTSTAITGETDSLTGDDSDSLRTSYRQMGKKYEALEFWGYVDGSDLQSCGIEIDDVELEYAANIWLLGTTIIKAALYEKALDEYKVFYYEKDETSIFGEGLARVMRHSQIAIAAAARMVLDNGACVAGPMLELNWSLMTPDTDLNSFYARKIWYREGKGIDASYPAIRPLSFDSHITELLSIIDAFKQFADEETTLPTWIIGQMVSNETAQAASGRQATITVSIKDVVKNFDAFTERVIRDMYAWNMDFNPRQDIKGDYKCKARGVASLVMKEIRMQALAQLTTTMTPEEWDYIPKREFLTEKFKAHDINMTLLSEEEVQKIREARESSKQMQLAIQMQEAEIGYKKAQTTAQLTKAKKANVEAIKEAQTPPEETAQTDPRITEGEIALQNTDKVAKEAEIRRKEEAHALELQRKNEAHATKAAIETSKAAHDIANKDKGASHALKMKEKMTEASAKAKAMAPKKEKKPKKGGIKG
jgi:hypothetical protein